MWSTEEWSPVLKYFLFIFFYNVWLTIPSEIMMLGWWHSIGNSCQNASISGSHDIKQLSIINMQCEFNRSANRDQDYERTGKIRFDRRLPVLVSGNTSLSQVLGKTSSGSLLVYCLFSH